MISTDLSNKKSQIIVISLLILGIGFSERLQKMLIPTFVIVISAAIFVRFSVILLVVVKSSR